MLNDKSREYGKTNVLSLAQLKEGFDNLDYIQTALLFGSRATDKAHDKSDYDFALLMIDNDKEIWGMESKAWSDLHDVFGLDDCDYDVINLKRTSSAMIESIKEAYIILKGNTDDISKLLN